jgi:hypothetical protein
VSANTLILDAKLLTLSIAGAASPQYIARHKRLRPYTEQDFFLLVEIIKAAKVTLVTPNTLTEASNWLAYIDDPARTHIFQTFARIIPTCQERFLESQHASEVREFLRLGLTDSVLLELAKDDGTLLTDDFDLYFAAVARGYNAINFTHRRAAYL